MNACKSLVCLELAQQAGGRLLVEGGLNSKTHNWGIEGVDLDAYAALIGARLSAAVAEQFPDLSKAQIKRVMQKSLGLNSAKKSIK